jgi:thiamine-monophosphate kinase
MSAGEFERIRAIIARLGDAAAADIGDDCAVIPAGPGTLVVSTDLSVEGVHFRTEWLTFEEIGWRCAAGALSDLAAQGASVAGLVASVGTPAAAQDDAVVRLMAGVGSAVREAGGTVLGGDLSRAPQWLVDITVFGRAARPVLRSGARAGDTVWVSGALGGARAALEAWQRGGAPTTEARRAFAHPVPRLGLGQILGAMGITAMLDLSDGLAGDAPHLAQASDVGLAIELERLPQHPDVTAAAQLAGIAPALFAAAGGEDYELLFTTSLPGDDVVRRAGASGVPVTQIGSVTADRGTRLLLAGQPQRLKGYDHFA